MNKNSEHHVDRKMMEEERLAIAQSKKDPKAFGLLYRRYFEDIFRFIYQRTTDKDLAKDITQQSFIKALNNIRKYEDRGLPFKSWLFRIAINEMNSHFRKDTKHQSVNIESAGLEMMFAEMEEEKPYESYKDRLIHILRELDNDKLQMIEMRFFEKRSFKEIGEILDITENNAKVRMYRLLDKLKGLMVKAA